MFICDYPLGLCRSSWAQAVHGFPPGEAPENSLPSFANKELESLLYHQIILRINKCFGDSVLKWSYARTPCFATKVLGIDSQNKQKYSRDICNNIWVYQFQSFFVHPGLILARMIEVVLNDRLGKKVIAFGHSLFIFQTIIRCVNECILGLIR